MRAFRVAAIAACSLFLTATPAVAGSPTDPDVVVRPGMCSGDARAQLTTINNGLTRQIRFEVFGGGGAVAPAGLSWNYRIFVDGLPAASGTGSDTDLRVEIVRAYDGTADRVVAQATNLRTGQSCAAALLSP